eukprot:5379149-Prymnesium_polylepis.2
MPTRGLVHASDCATGTTMQRPAQGSSTWASMTAHQKLAYGRERTRHAGIVAKKLAPILLGC